MHLIITVIPTEDEEFEMRDSTLIDEAQHNLLDLWEEADWKVKR
jgi:hypothetical protein